MNVEALLSIEPLSWRAIGAAIFCGTTIGLERQLRGKPVGIRTATLITLGTYIFLQLSLAFNADGMETNRVIGQIITGIGFLGAGVMLAKDGAVVGVTSAATIWVLASLGVCIGIGHLGIAIKMAFLTVFILYGVDLLEEHTKTFSRGVHSRIKLRRQPQDNRRHTDKPL